MAATVLWGIIVLVVVAVASFSDIHKPYCGHRREDSDDGEFRILGGESADRGSWPWMAQIRHWNGSTYETRCGGTLIYPNYVITARHCVDFIERTDELEIRVGVLDRVKADRFTQTFSVTNKIVLPFGRRSSTNDIALLRLNSSAEYHDHMAVLPACLPRTSPKFLTRLRNRNAECYLLGWGIHDMKELKQADHLQQMRVRLFPPKLCQQPGYFFRRQVHLCAGQPPSKQEGSCKGDSGGGLVCRAPGDDRWRLIAVYSRGFDTCSSASIYMRVTRRVKLWVRDVIEKIETLHGGYQKIRYCSLNEGCKLYPWTKLYD